MKLKFTTSYERISKFYEFFDRMNYGVSNASRNVFLGSLPVKPFNGLFVGCGPGAFVEAFVKSESPSEITINDLSPSMLEITKKRISRTNWKGKLKTEMCDVLNIEADRPFDFISANYILNLFKSEDRVKILCHLKSLMSARGALQVVDFVKPRGLFPRIVSTLNWWLGNIFFLIIAQNKPTELGDMEQLFKEAGFSVMKKSEFSFGLYCSYLLQVR